MPASPGSRPALLAYALGALAQLQIAAQLGGARPYRRLSGGKCELQLAAEPCGACASQTAGQYVEPRR